MGDGSSPSRSPIDWEQVAAERQTRRERLEAQHRRRVVAAVLVALGALAVFVGVAANRAGTRPLRPTLSSTTTVPAPPASTPGAAEGENPAGDTPTVSTPESDAVTTVSVFQLEAGMCVDNPELSAGLVSDLKVVACDVAHSHEVFFKVAYRPPGGQFDDAAVNAFADEQCAKAFTDYVGVPYDRSTYYFLNLAPSAQSWKTQDDRDVACLLFQQGSMLTGSAKGTAR